MEYSPFNINECDTESLLLRIVLAHLLKAASQIKRVVLKRMVSITPERLATTLLSKGSFFKTMPDRACAKYKHISCKATGRVFAVLSQHSKGNHARIARSLSFYYILQGGYGTT